MGNTPLHAVLRDTSAVSLVDAILPFDNLRVRDIEAYWRSFYDHATSFALTRTDLRQICSRAVCSMDPHASTKRAMEHADLAFGVFMVQTDQFLPDSNQPLCEMDALELFSAMVFIGAMSSVDKIDLLFDSWDMSEDGALDLDEFTISLKSTLSGLCKILKMPANTGRSSAAKPAKSLAQSLDEDEVDALAERVFREIAKVSQSTPVASLNQLTITCDQFRAYCNDSKQVVQLLDVFDRLSVRVDVTDNEDSDVGEGDNNKSGAVHDVAQLQALLQRVETKASKSDDPAVAVGFGPAHSDDHGDEFLAVKPWKGAIVPPTKVPPLNKSAPSASIHLDWVFGYNAHDSTNNVRYCQTNNDEIMYPAAACCIVLNLKTMQQRHQLTHTDDVLSLCLHPKAALAASGEIGKTPKIIVWETQSMAPLCVLQGFHQRGVLQLAFVTADILVSVGGDDDHSVGVYETKDAWKSATLQWHAKGNKSVPLSLAVSSVNANALPTSFVVCGQKFVDFWSLDGKAVSAKKAVLGKQGSLQAFHCAEYLGAANANAGAIAVVGANDGSLYLFQGNSLTNVVKAHGSAVHALHWSGGALVSGGKDGQIIVWDDRLKQIAGPFQVKDLLVTSQPRPPYVAVRSCCFSSDKKRLLLGTQAAEIYEIDARTGQNARGAALVKAHFAGELWGLAMHPTKQQCCTVGDDQTLRIWDLVTKKEVRSASLDVPARACAYSGDGKLIAVGLGSDGIAGSKTSTAATKPVGGFMAFHEADLSKAKEATMDPKKWVSDVKFSPDSRTLAVASHDTNIYFYDVLKGFAKRQVFKKHGSYVTHVDFSSDGGFLQSTCGAYELLFSEVKTAKHVTNASTFRDERWNTMTTTLGWSVQGIWEEGSDGTDVNAVDRSKDGTLLATGDDFGKVKVFRYPCAQEKAAYLTLRGHSSHVANVRWSHGDHFLVSVGGNDRSVFIWKHETAGGSDMLKYDEHRTAAAPVKADTVADLLPERGDPLDGLNDDDAGDEFMAVKPWLGAIVAPSSSQGVQYPASSPDCHMELARVHGYQSENAANNARYDKSGRIVYHGAAVGIVYERGTHTQQFVKAHDDDIVALATHPKGELFATAQMGKKPKIYVWNAGQPNRTLACLAGFHQRSVTAVCFSSDGTKIGSVGADDDHSVAIYAWEANGGLLLASAKGERGNVLAMAFDDASGDWVSCGDKHVRFWKEQGKNLSSKKALFGTKCKHKDGKAPAVFVSIAAFAKTVAIGASNGDLYVFPSGSNEISKIVTAHSANAAAMSVNANGTELVSGGKDGTIMVWDSSYSLLWKVDIKEQLVLECPWLLVPGIRSVCFSPRGSRMLLVGTSGSDLFELDASRAAKPTVSAIITQGHSALEVWGLAVHPTKPEYCTVGDDQTLRVWCFVKKIQLRVRRMDCMARACAIAPSGDIVAVGLGGRNAAAARGKSGAPAKSLVLTGSVLLLQYNDLGKRVFEDKPSKQPISDIKFSPTGAVLAVGSHDHVIYLYKISDNFAKVAKIASFAKHQSYITHFDFSVDGQYLQSTCGAYELLFSQATTGKHVTSASAMKDTQWATWTSTLGWPVQGIWPPCSDGTDVNAVARSDRGDLLASGDDFGKVKLYRYPCVAKNAGAVERTGHSSHVTNVRWIGHDAAIVSTGGNDRCVMEWKVVRDGDDGDNDRPDDPHARESKATNGGVAELDLRALVGGSSTLREVVHEDDIEVELDEPSGGGDEFMAVKPWLGAIVAPSNAPAPNSREPDLQVQLEWVYGYQTELSQQNLVYNSHGEIVYHTAAVGVIYDHQNHLQKHHIGHNDDILSFAAQRDLVVTGERGKKPVIRVWDAHTGEQRCELKGFHARGVLSVAFSQDMTRLISVGDDDDHSVALWEDKSHGSWTMGALVATAKGDKGVNRFALMQGGNGEIVTGGAKHVLFWQVEGKAMTSRKGKVGKKGTLQDFPCGCWFQDDLVTGTAGGELYVWKAGELMKVVKAHEGGVCVVTTTMSSALDKAATSSLVSGGKDGKILVWSASFQSIKCIELEALGAGCLHKAVRSVFVSSNGQKLLVGTGSSDILEVDMATGILIGGKAVFSGHFAMELWGLAVHPSSRKFVTTGDDGTLRVWDMETKQLVQLIRLPTKARACAFSPDGKQLAVGYGGDNGVRRRAPPGKNVKKGKDGAIAVLDLTSPDCKPVFEDQPAKEWISDVKFSPCGKLLAFGSHDNAVHLYSGSGSSGDWKKRKPFAKHNSYITHLDFSHDGKFLQSNCGAYELLFCDTGSSEQVRSATAMKDTQWATWTCTLGWPVQGIWPECADGTDVNSVCASASRTVLATADDFGLVKFFRYPCTMKGAKCIEKRGHSSHVTNVRFSCDDKYLISTGGNDRSVFQWKLS